jgi:CBS domain-containing protein
MMSRVRDIVHNRDLFSVEETDTVAAVARRMAELHVGAILVLNRGDLRGLFSERDLMRRVVLERLDPERTPVSEVMSRDLATVDEMASIEDAMEMMRRCNCRHLPVLRGSRVVAFLSMRDVMNYELERKTEELHHMRAYIHGSA